MLRSGVGEGRASGADVALERVLEAFDARTGEVAERLDLHVGAVGLLHHAFRGADRAIQGSQGSLAARLEALALLLGADFLLGRLRSGGGLVLLGLGLCHWSHFQTVRERET